MIKIFNKLLCAVVVMASHGWTADKGLRIEFDSEHFTYKSLTEADRTEFEELSAQHNSQANVLIVENVFDNHIARCDAGNAWHMLMIRNRGSNELVAALSMGRIPSIIEKYNPDNHAEIIAYFRDLGHATRHFFERRD